MSEAGKYSIVSKAHERNIVACILTNVDMLEEVDLPVAAFEDESMRVVYSTVIDLKNEGNTVNVSTLRTFFDHSDAFAEIVQKHGGYQFIENLAAKPDFMNFKLHQSELHRRFSIRETKARAEMALDAIKNTEINDPKEVMDIIDTHLSGGDFVKENETMDTDELNSAWLDKQTAMYFAGEFTANGIPVLNEHLRRILGDQVTHGSMNTLAGETNIGKSQWVSLLVRHFTHQQGIPTLVLDNELSKKEFRNRTLANLSGVRLKNIFNGYAFSPASPDYGDMKKAIAIMDKTPLIWRQVLDMTIERMEPIIRRFLRKYPVAQFPHKIIIVDGIKMQNGNDSYIEVGFFAQKMKSMAQKYEGEGIAFFPTCQLNRGGSARNITKEKELHPDHTSIGLSKLIADNSDDVYILTKHMDVDAQGTKVYSKFNRRLICTKARNHATFDGLNYVLMGFDGSRCFLEPTTSCGPDVEQEMPAVDPSQEPSY